MAQAKRNTRTAKSNSLPQAADIPAGMRKLSGGNAPTWKPDEGDSIQGVVSDVIKTVEFTAKKKVNGKMTEVTQERRVFEITDSEGNRHAIWESAALAELFDVVEEAGEGLGVYLKFTGYGKKKPGQNPPKLFDVAVTE